MADEERRGYEPKPLPVRYALAAALSVLLAYQPVGIALAETTSPPSSDEQALIILNGSSQGEQDVASSQNQEDSSSIEVITDDETTSSLSANGTTDQSGSPTVTAQSSTADYSAHLTFSNSGITETSAGSGYTISGTTLTISSPGTYRIDGTCSEGSIEVKKEVAGVTLEFDGLNLTSSSTAPIVAKKSSQVAIRLMDGTTSTFTNAEDPANETSSDATIADAFEGACIKAKAGSSVTFCGGGDLTCVANAKNGIKGGATSTLTFNQSGTVTITGNYNGSATSAGAANNGIAADGTVIINQGTFDVAAANDGIKSVPDTDDADSVGSIYINGGTIRMAVDGDGIQAETLLRIAAGTFDITTYKGYSTWNDTLADSMSCKGLKASGDREGIENAIEITGGTFTLNCGDDAVHSDANVTVTGGTFSIQTGDDGMHADTTLELGTADGLARDPDVTIEHSYEGLEGAEVYIRNGRYYVIATDDGINAAGGSSNGTDPGPGGRQDPFRPGPFGPRFGVQDDSDVDQNQLSAQASSYNIQISGGDVYVNCSGDGLDSKGGLYLTGGTQIVFSQAPNGDNSALDADGTVSINGATVFTSGIAGMDGTAKTSWFGSGQRYVAQSATYSANTVVNATVGGNVVFSTKLPKQTRYTLFSAPGLSATPSLITTTDVTKCKGGTWSHNWNEGTTANGTTTYTCTDCGATETQTASSTTDEASQSVFPDVTESTPHASDIYWLATNAITTGFPDGTYRPMQAVVRQDMAAFLYRLGKLWGIVDDDWQPSDEQKSVFPDVTEDTPHYREIMWLAAQGISTGYPDGTFRPMLSVTRQDMAAFLFRLAKLAKKGDATDAWQPTEEQTSAFSDVTDDTPHSREVAWLAATGVSTGYPDGTFRPLFSVVRQDMAAFLHRLDSLS